MSRRMSLGSASLCALLAIPTVLTTCALAGCSSDSLGSATTGGTTSGTTTGSGMGRPHDPSVTPNLQGRAYDLIAPDGLDPKTPSPLVLMLHGFTDAADTQAPWADMDKYMGISVETKKRGMLVALGHGSLDPTLNHYFWNATDACCDLDNLMPDDVGYLMGVVEDVKSKYAVDDKRIFVLGHSNGGFMAHRLACDQADKFAAIVSLAGETFTDQTKCAASAPIGMLQVQGDADQTVFYGGGPPEGVAVLPVAPGAVETARDWSIKNDCSTKTDTSEPPVDLVTDLDGAETSKVVYEGCQANGATELWTIHGGPHVPDFNASWAPTVLDFMMAHPKP